MGVSVWFLAVKARGISAPWPAGDWTWLVWTPCPGRQSFNHWTTREVSNPLKENNSEHLVHSQYHATFLSYFRTFPSPQNAALYSLAGSPCLPIPLLLETANLLSVSVALPILDVSYEGNHTLRDTLCLASFTQRNVFEVQPCCSMSQCFFIFDVCVNHSVVSDSLRSHGLYPSRLLCPWNSPGKDTGVGCYSPLHQIFLIQGLNPILPHFKQILYSLSHQGTVIFNDWIIFHCTEVLLNPSSYCLLHNRPINEETSWGKQYRLYLESQQTEKMVG